VAGEKVLVVDDSADSIRFLTDYVLKPNGYIPLVAQDGEKGLSQALKEQPDLILLDLKMPRLSGLEFLKRLRDTKAEIPVIFMTFYGSEETAVQAFRLGVRDYLIKPFTADEALKAIRQALSEKALWRERRLARTEVPSKLSRQLNRKKRELSAFYSITRSIASGLELGVLLERIVEAALYVTGAEEGCLLLLQEESGDLYVWTAKGPRAELLQGLLVKNGRHPLSLVLQGDKAITLSGLSLAGYPVKIAACAPVRKGKETLGILLANHVARTERVFTGEDLFALSFLAYQAAIAIGYSRLRRTGRGGT